MALTIESARSPEYADEGNESIRIIVKFKELSYEVPFIAQSNDSEAHGRDLYARACTGEFGAIAAYVKPAEEEKK
jgi:hypothetical protein